MNQYNQVPRKFPDRQKVITDKFPEADPIFWGPNQRILEDGKYVEPDGFRHNRALEVPKIVRFITDAHEEDATPRPSCTYEPGFLFDVPAGIPVFSISFRRVIGARMDGGKWWIDCPAATLDPNADTFGRGVAQDINALTGELVIVQPDVNLRDPTIPFGYPGSVVPSTFAHVLASGNAEVCGYTLTWRWYTVPSHALIGQTFRFSPADLIPWPGNELLSPVNTNPICPTDYQLGCPCLP